MDENVTEKLSEIVNNKLTTGQIEELEGFFRQALSSSLEKDDEDFFKTLAYEMSGEVKELAMLVIDFKKDLKSKISPELTDIATKYIPQTTDQLEGIIETTEMAANKIMDNLENIQEQTETVGAFFTSLKGGEAGLPGGEKLCFDSRTIETISPIIGYMESVVQKTMSLISDTFVQMSFQDLTGQRIKRIMTLVSQMETKLKDMVIAFGIKLTQHEKNPDITKKELQKVVGEKVVTLIGPQKQGQGLDQGDIDNLLSNL